MTLTTVREQYLEKLREITKKYTPDGGIINEVMAITDAIVMYVHTYSYKEGMEAMHKVYNGSSKVFGTKKEV